MRFQMQVMGILIFFLLSSVGWSQVEFAPPEWVFGELKLFVEGFGAPECPNLDYVGNLYICDFRNNNIYKITPDGTKIVVAKVGLRNNGLIIDADDNFYIGDVDGSAVYFLSTDGSVRLVANRNHIDKPFNGPNDFTWDNHGRLYMTDPKGSSINNPIGAVYFFDEHEQVYCVADSLCFPNGLTFSNDFLNLYLTETHMSRVLRFEVTPDGLLTNRTIFVDLGERVLPDGMKCDDQGNLWVAAYTEAAIWCFNPSGEKIASIKIPGQDPHPSNIIFGGIQRKTAYITVNDKGNGKIFSITMPVSGRSMIPEKR